ncbi:MFS transporter [Allorhizobium sp. BGMRC 0089]|uniref:MFS transporter n=1 Tax=Allorhizobium sonneratiae TaxID=2934936 RepID=UPI0020341160|nr:MFS transporter [Allorhizobium sonneratiae]MCM2292870.1 MFS transporter [Allorhizobium sonneratiae]
MFDRKTIISLAVLSVTQIIGWGTLSLPAVSGRQMAAETGLSLPEIFSGNSILYVVMGICAPFLGTYFVRYGARRVMILGTMIMLPGYVLISLAHGPVFYLLGWLVLGVGGSATLTTAAYIQLNEIAGAKAKSAIGALMLLTGLSSSIFWPISWTLSEHFGWRATAQMFSLTLLVCSLPLYLFCLPKFEKPAGLAGTPVPRRDVTARRFNSVFVMIVSAIALNSFVTFGLAAIMIELLKAIGLSPSEATAFGSLLGVLQVSARGMDFIGGGRWDGISTGITGGCALPLSMLLLLFAPHTHGTIVVFLIIYGLGSGALAVARATIPLVFYEKADYAQASSKMALPLNIISALAAPVLIAVLSSVGIAALLTLTLACSSTALLLLLFLAKARPVSPVLTV